MIYFPVIKDWSASTHGHLEGGMEYENGKLMVPKAGRYYIYAQLTFLSEGRVLMLVNDDFVSLIISPLSPLSPLLKGDAVATASGSGVFVLNAGDSISLRIRPYGAPDNGSVKLYMDFYQCYFGAFLI